jgi:hypothetical protein
MQNRRIDGGPGAGSDLRPMLGFKLVGKAVLIEPMISSSQAGMTPSHGSYLFLIVGSALQNVADD